MKNIYDATNKEKKEIIDYMNDTNGFDRTLIYRRCKFEITEMVLICNIFRIKDLFKENLSVTWSINGIETQGNNKSIFIIDAFEEHINDKLESIGPSNTSFKEPIKLSKESIILMPLSVYQHLPKDEKNKIDMIDKEKH